MFSGRGDNEMTIQVDDEINAIRAPLQHVVRRRPEWMSELLARDSFTAKEAGEVVGCVGADAITRLRNCRSVVVEIIDNTPRRKIYRLKEAV